MSMRLSVALVATLTSITAIFVLNPRWGGTAYAISLALILLISISGPNNSIARSVLKWTLPFALPLIAIHGLLNSQYPITNWFFDFVPIRQAGVEFGYDVSVRLLILSITGAFWLAIDRDEFTEALIRLGLPTYLVMLAMQGFVMARLIENRVHAIHLAQRARGIPVAASFFERVRSIPALLIPVVIGTFVEAEARVPSLLAHGYGRVDPMARPSVALNSKDWIQAGALLACLGVGQICEQLL
jgi:energy-coupling factor transporter transmembrane protein EcfT